MSLRSKLAIAFAVLAAVVSGLMGVLGYTATADQLERATDAALVAGAGMRGPEERRRQDATLLLSAQGQTVDTDGDVLLPVTPADREAAAAPRGSVSARTQEVDGTPYRIVTIAPGQSRGALLIARDWSQSAAVLQRLAVVLAASAAALALVAAGIGWLIARQITGRLVRLTDTAEAVSTTGQLDVAVPGAGRDEVGRLATAFNAMLARLAASQADQQRLIQDAGHELRTPLTSLRTNISLLERFEDLSPDVRQRVLADLRGESRELTGLVDEVLNLARGHAFEGDPEEVQLANVCRRVAGRALRRLERRVEVAADDSVVVASPAALERAVWNLVENAAKFDISDGPIEIAVDGGRLEVRDRGPGVDPGEIPHLFDRFYRPVASRSLPGSGLGLAIVKDVADASGGRVFAGPRDGGGSVFGIHWPQNRR